MVSVTGASGKLLFSSLPIFLGVLFFPFLALMASTRLCDPGFLNGTSPALSFKDAMSWASLYSVPFYDLCISSHRGLPSLLILEEEISSLMCRWNLLWLVGFPAMVIPLMSFKSFSLT